MDEQYHLYLKLQSTKTDRLSKHNSLLYHLYLKLQSTKTSSSKNELYRF